MAAGGGDACGAGVAGLDIDERLKAAPDMIPTCRYGSTLLRVRKELLGSGPSTRVSRVLDS